MRSLIVTSFITLDGVVQGGGGPEEDPDGGFPHGGWATDYDAVLADVEPMSPIERSGDDLWFL